MHRRCSDDWAQKEAVRRTRVLCFIFNVGQHDGERLCTIEERKIEALVVEPDM